jgi:hypothetical protein
MAANEATCAGDDRSPTAPPLASRSGH